MKEARPKISRYAEQPRDARETSGCAHLHRSVERRAMRVSPDEPHTGDACQSITKVNERAFIYTSNFDTYDGQKIWNPNLHSGTHGGARRWL
jgi:hypothetical protein